MDKRDYKWIIGILLTIIGLLLISIIMIVSYKLSNDRDMVNIISIGSGLVSIVLGLVAIFYAGIQSYQSSGQNTQLNNTMNQIDKRVDELSLIAIKIENVKESISSFKNDSENNFVILANHLSEIKNYINTFIDKLESGNQSIDKNFIKEFKDDINSKFQIIKAQLINLIETLTPDEQKIIRLRFGLDDGIARGYSEIASEMNISEDRVKQVEEQALRRLRKYSTLLDFDSNL